MGAESSDGEDQLTPRSVKSSTVIQEWFWEYSATTTLYMYAGTDVAGKVVLVQRSGSCVVTTRSCVTLRSLYRTLSRL